MMFIDEIRFYYLRAFLAFQVLSKAYSIQCYYYPNYPLLESSVQVNCKSSCCNGYPETEATTCCYVSKASTPWYIYLIIILIAAITGGFMILAMIYYIIRRNSLRRQTAMVYPGGRGVLPTMHIELQPYYLTTYDSPFIDRAQLYQTYNSAIYQLPNQFINASTTTSHVDYLNQQQPSNNNNSSDVNLNRQIINSEFKSH